MTKHVLRALRPSTHTHTHLITPHTNYINTILLSLTRHSISLDPYTRLQTNHTVTSIKTWHNALKSTPSVSGTSISGTSSQPSSISGTSVSGTSVSGRLPPSQGHPSQGHPSRAVFLHLGDIRLGAIHLGDIRLRDGEGQDEWHRRISPRWKDMKTEGPSVSAFRLRGISLCLSSSSVSATSDSAPSAFHNVKKNKNNTPFVSGTFVSVFLPLRLPPSQRHPSQGHPSQGHPSRPSSVSAPSVSRTSVSGESVSGASVSGTSVFETAKAKTNDTDGYPRDGKTWRRRAHLSQLSVSGASACAFRLCHPSPVIQLQ